MQRDRLEFAAKRLTIDVGLLATRLVKLVLLFDLVENSTSPLQTHFWPVFGDEAVQAGLLFPA